MTTAWTPVATLDDLADGEVRAVEVAGHSLLLARSGKAVIACSRLCPHEKADLALGHIEEGRLMCPRHRASFSLTTGAVSPGWRVAALALYPIRVEGQAIAVDAKAIGQAGQRDLWDLTTP